MVRTLVFQSNNVGSIPTGPIMVKYHYEQLLMLNEKNFKSRVTFLTYEFRFISLISPFLLNNLRIHDVTSSPTTAKKPTVLLKQSYLLFTWFYYLKESKVNILKQKNKSIKFSFLPTKRTMYTITKAPMAHKTNSKEQIVYRYFKFKISVKSYFKESCNIRSFNQSLLLIFLTKSEFPIFETNLLLLKNYRILLSASDSNYFSFFFFNKNQDKRLL